MMNQTNSGREVRVADENKYSTLLGGPDDEEEDSMMMGGGMGFYHGAAVNNNHPLAMHRNPGVFPQSEAVQQQFPAEDLGLQNQASADAEYQRVIEESLKHAQENGTGMSLEEEEL